MAGLAFGCGSVVNTAPDLALIFPASFSPLWTSAIVWAGRELGTRWTTHNIAAIHNRLLAPEMSAWSFNEALANGTAEVRLSL